MIESTKIGTERPIGRGPPTCQRPGCTETADMVSEYVYCLDHSTSGGDLVGIPTSIEPEGIATDDFTFYFGASCGSSRKTLRQLEEPNVCISYGTRDKTPWDGIDSLLVDSGGYSLIKRGEGEYPDHVDDYLEYLEDVDADFFMTRDVPTAPRVLSKLDRGSSEAIARTVEYTVETLERLQHFDVDAEPVAVLQGTTPAEYVKCYKELLREEAVTSRIAIGSLKKRSPAEVARIVEEVRGFVDDSIELHGLGVEVPELEYRSVRSALASADSSRYISTARWRGNRDEHPPRLRDDEPATSWYEVSRAYLDMREELRETITTEGEGIETDAGDGQITRATADD